MNVHSNTPTVIFGGTFDPVHFGHLRAAWEAREALGECDFRFVPAGTPPHRGQQVTESEHRLHMLRLAVPEASGIVVDPRELEREGPSYMVDTLAELREERRTTPLVLLLGQDSANTLDSWHRWRELPELAHLVVMSRAGDIRRYSPAVEALLAGRQAGSPAELRARPSGCFWSVQVSSLAISSSRIRQLVAAGQAPRFLLPDTVLAYIERHDLYRDSAPGPENGY